MAPTLVRKNNDGSFQMPDGWMPSDEDLEVIREELIRLAGTTKSAPECCRILGLRPLVLRQLRITDPKFQIAFDIALQGQAVPRHLVGQGRVAARTRGGTSASHHTDCDSIDHELKILKGDGIIRKAPQSITADLYPHIAKAIEETGMMTRAAALAGVRLGTLRKEMERSPELSELVAESQQKYNDHLREAARQRAVEGYLVPMLGGKDRDQVVAYEQRFSDKLLEMELKRVDPAYRDHRVVEQVTTVSMQEAFDMTRMSMRARAKLKELLLILKEDEEEEKAAREAAVEDGRLIEEPVLDAEFTETPP